MDFNYIEIKSNVGFCSVPIHFFILALMSSLQHSSPSHIVIDSKGFKYSRTVSVNRERFKWIDDGLLKLKGVYFHKQRHYKWIKLLFFRVSALYDLIANFIHCSVAAIIVLKYHPYKEEGYNINYRREGARDQDIH